MTTNFTQLKRALNALYLVVEPDIVENIATRVCSCIQELRSALSPFIQHDVISYAQSLIDEDEERYPKSHKPHAVTFADEFGHAGLKAIDFIEAKNIWSRIGD